MTYKRLLLLALLVVATKTNAQIVTRYFLLDKQEQNGFRFNHIKCSDGTFKAELFNVFYNKDSSCFTLFSALPDLEKKIPVWKEIGLDTIRERLVSADSLNKRLNNGRYMYFSTEGASNSGILLKDEWTKPVIVKEGKYYTPVSPTLMEHFVLINNSKTETFIANIFPNLNQFFEINIDAAIFPLAKFENAYIQKFKHPSFNSLYDQEFDRYNTHYVYNKPVLIRDNNTMIDGKKAFKFWTLASWMIDGRNNERGIDRFAYIPGTGIVSGAFSYLFWDNNKGKVKTPPASQLVNNYLKDVQLMPYEINGRSVKK